MQKGHFMLHRPAEQVLWDTWLYFHPETKQYHLFYLVRESLGRPTPVINHAVSADAVEWTAVEALLPQAGRNLNTGMVFSRGGEYYLTYGCNGIYLLRARDGQNLRDWEYVGRQPLLTPATPGFAEHYECDPARLTKPEPDFRDAFFLEGEGERRVLLAARWLQGPPGGRGAVALAVSADGVNWRFEPPVAAPGRFYQMEVPDHFVLADRHYLLFSDFSFHVRQDTPTRRQVAGTFYALAEDFAGPYRVPEESLLTGCADGQFGSYVGRHVFAEDEHLFYNHLIAGGRICALGLLQAFRVRSDGTLVLVPWERGIARLRAQPLELPPAPEPFCAGAVPAGNWRRSGEALLATCEIGLHAAFWPEEIGDCELVGDFAGRTGQAGWLFRYDGATGRGQGVLLDFTRREASLVNATTGRDRPFVQAIPFETVRIPELKAGAGRVRLLLRGDFLAVYLNGELLFHTGLGQLVPAGQLGLLAGGGELGFTALSGFKLKPLRPTSFPAAQPLAEPQKRSNVRLQK